MNKKKIKLATWRGVENKMQMVKDDGQRLFNIVVDIVLMLIFVWASRTMLKDIFGVGAMSGAGALGCIIVTGIVSGLMELLDNGVYRQNKLLKRSLPIIGFFVLFIYLFMFKGGRRILGGLVNFASLYMQKWNVYYRTGIRIKEVKGGSIELAVSFSIILLIILLVWFGKSKGKRLFYGIIPVLVVAMEVTVGYAPSKKGFIIMLVGMFLANVLEYERVDFVKVTKESVSGALRRKYVYMVIVSGVIVIGSVCAQNLVSSSVNETLKYSSDVRAIQRSMIEDFSVSELIKSISEAIWNKNRNGEIISNTRLSFKNVPVLKMYADSMPMNKMYLKEFYGSEYIGGKWVNDGDEFERDAGKAGFSVETMKQEMSSMGMGKKYEYSYPIKVRLGYLKNSKVAYVPYCSELSEDIKIHGGVYYTKDKELSEISYKVWENTMDYTEYGNSYEQNEEMEWEEWYEQYVCDKYLSVPNGMTAIKELAYELAVKNGLMTLEGVPGENLMRIKAANAIAQWMAKTMTYTQAPPALPRNADPVEYFATESNKGYCMHYASAATLILREIGVPARYASGYFVTKSDFEFADNEYVGTILDNAAHAWVEIYLDNIGWIPIEVTTSYADGVNPNAESVNKDKETEELSSSSGLEDNDDEITSEITSSMNESASANAPSVAGKEEKTNKGPGFYGTNNSALSGSTLGKVLLIAAFAIVIPAVIYGVLRYYRLKEEKLRILVERKRKATAIKTINRNLYVKLKKKGKLIGREHSDDAYKEGLIKTYPEVSEEEWNRYMDIVKETAFSNNDGDEDDMEYCYEIYKRVREKRRK